MGPGPAGTGAQSCSEAHLDLKHLIERLTMGRLMCKQRRAVAQLPFLRLCRCFLYVTSWKVTFGYRTRCCPICSCDPTGVTIVHADKLLEKVVVCQIWYEMTTRKNSAIPEWNLRMLNPEGESSGTRLLIKVGGFE